MWGTPIYKRWGNSSEILKKKPLEVQDAVLWAWLQTFFTRKRHQFSNISCHVFWTQYPKRYRKSFHCCNLVPRVSHLTAWGERGDGKMRDPVDLKRENLKCLTSTPVPFTWKFPHPQGVLLTKRHWSVTSMYLVSCPELTSPPLQAPLLRARPHYPGEIWASNNHRPFSICVWGKLGQWNHMIIQSRFQSPRYPCPAMTSYFSQSFVVEGFSFHTKTQRPTFSNSSGLKCVFTELLFVTD